MREEVGRIENVTAKQMMMMMTMMMMNRKNHK